MWVRVGILALLLSATTSAQTLTVDALVRLVRSSIELGHKDKQVAKYLETVQLSEKLDTGTIEDLEGDGAGPHTLEALKALQAASAKLEKAAPVVEEKRPERPAPSPEEQDRILEAVRQYAMSYTRQLPDFICTQVTRRYVDPTGMQFWHKQDTITAKLSYFNQQEEYKVVLVNNYPVTMDMHDVGGSTSTGEFGSMMKELFDPETDAQFKWVRWGKLRGRLCHVYQYSVRKSRSKWSISFEISEGNTVRTIPAYRGFVFVDNDTEMVTRITLEAVNIEPSFPVQEASTELDYELIPISGQEFMLPLKFEMNMRQGRMLTKNDVEFRLYNKYSANASISFDVPDELPKDMFSEEPASQEGPPTQEKPPNQ